MSLWDSNLGSKKGLSPKDYLDLLRKETNMDKNEYPPVFSLVCPQCNVPWQLCVCDGTYSG